MERRRRRGHGSGVVMATGLALVAFWVLSGGTGAGAVEEPLPTVTIEAAADGSFSENTPGCDQSSASLGRGELVVTRTGPTDLPLVVRYGASSPDEDDFEPLPGTVTIPEGEATATIGVTPQFAEQPAPVHVHRTGEVTITLTDTAAYDVGDAGEATIGLRFDVDIEVCTPPTTSPPVAPAANPPAPTPAPAPAPAPAAASAATSSAPGANPATLPFTGPPLAGPLTGIGAVLLTLGGAAMRYAHPRERRRRPRI
jgi:hypothetical protein